MTQVLLFVVDDAFQIRERGCVLVPGPSTEPDAPRIRVGTLIRLEFPNGTSRETSVRGLEMINFRGRPRAITAPILLPPDIRKEDVPRGTHVYLAETVTK